MPIHKSANFRVSVVGLKDDEKLPNISIQPDPSGLQRTGPLIDVNISVTIDHAKLLEINQQATLQPIAGKALIDTGASISVVDVKVLEKLSVNPVGVCIVRTPQGTDFQQKLQLKYHSLAHNWQMFNQLTSWAVLPSETKE